MSLDWDEGALAEGLRCYASGAFFSAHEAWERAWLEFREPEKTLLQALIQVAAAFHHLQRNNPRGAAKLLRAALQRLEPYPARLDGIEVARLRDDLHDRLRVVDADESPAEISAPRIQRC